MRVYYCISVFLTVLIVSEYVGYFLRSMNAPVRQVGAAPRPPHRLRRPRPPPRPLRPHRPRLLPAGTAPPSPPPPARSPSWPRAPAPGTPRPPPCTCTPSRSPPPPSTATTGALALPPVKELLPRAFEFAAVNPRVQGRKYRFAYGLGFPTGYLVRRVQGGAGQPGLQVGTLHKLDVEAKQFTHMWEDPACRASEPLFVPRCSSPLPPSRAVSSTKHPQAGRHRGGGWRGGVRLPRHRPGPLPAPPRPIPPPQAKPSTSLVVLHPRDLTELGRFSVPHTTPVGFHGIWLPK
jgi:hypothetical protein